MTKPNLKCYICQKPIYRIPSKWNGHNVCSYACRNKYYLKEKSFAYKHGKCIMDKNGKIGKNEERDRTRDKLRRIAFKIKAINYLGGKCQIYGYDKCIASLDFHHKDPKLKNKSIKDLSLGSWEKIQKELDKCMLLCANCHRELHWEKNHGPDFMIEVNEYLSTYVPKKEQKGPKHYMYGKEHPEEVKRKISEGNKGKKRSKEVKKKMSESRKGENNYMYGKRGKDSPNWGKKRTEESRLKTSKALKGRKFSDEHKRNLSGSNNNRSISVIIDGKYFHTYKEAGEFVGVLPETISRRIKNKYPGYLYANEGDKERYGL